MAYFRSTPADIFGLKVFLNGFPACSGCVTAVATEYGISSRRFDEPDGDTPSSWPSCDITPLTLRAINGHPDVSLKRGIWRSTPNPMVFLVPSLNRSCE